MTWSETFSIAQAVVLTVATVIAFTLRKSFSGGATLQAYINRLESVERRMTDAGEKMSDFATELQGMPERFRREFVTQREVDQRFHGLDRQIRDVWSAINRRHS